jgi:tRNA(Ile)-lysidine synthetase-like protein
MNAWQRDKNIVVLDADALHEAAATPVLRTRRAGDRISPEGFDGRKKIQDLFVDMKIPRDERERIVLLALGSDVLWIPGMRKTRKYAVGKDTKRVLLIRFANEDDLSPPSTGF